MTKDNRVDFFLASVCCVFFLCEFLLVNLAATHGLELTDEGYALLWIRDHSQYSMTTTHFGLVYGPIYLLLGHDIVLLRAFNLSLSVFLAFVVLWQLLRDNAVIGSSSGRVFAAIIAATGAVACLSYTQFWLPTPNYNWLLLQGQLIGCIGLTIRRGPETSSVPLVAGAVLVGFAGWLMFMAKPPNAAIAGLIIAITWCFFYKMAVRRIAIALSIFSILLWLTAILWGGSPSAFLLHLIESNQLSRILRQSSTARLLFRQDGLLWTPFERDVFIGIVITCFMTSNLILHRLRSSYLLLLPVVTICLIGLVEGLIFQGGYKRSLMQQIWIYAPPLGNSCAVALHAFRHRPEGGGWLGTLPALLLMPVAYAVASGNNLWLQLGNAGFFAVAAAILLAGCLAPLEARRAILLWNGLSAAAIALVLTSVGISDPYRQTQAVLSQNTPAKSLPLLAPDMAHYIETIGHAMDSGGSGARKILLDMTGLNPGLAYAVGAEAPGQPWLLGGYPYSREWVHAALIDVTCSDFAMAFVLRSTDGKRKLPDDALVPFGLLLNEDYRQVVALEYPPTGERVVLLAPADTRHLEAECESKRDRTSIKILLGGIPADSSLDQLLLKLAEMLSK